MTSKIPSDDQYIGFAFGLLLLSSIFFTLILVGNNIQAFGIIILNGVTMICCYLYGKRDLHEYLQNMQ